MTSKPYQNEREANDAPAARRARAMVDAMFRAGTFNPGDQVDPYSAIIFDALKAAGVEISPWEERVPHWLGGWEVYQCQVIARFIEAAYEAGRQGRTPSPSAAEIAEWLDQSGWFINGTGPGGNMYESPAGIRVGVPVSNDDPDAIAAAVKRIAKAAGISEATLAREMREC